ncbi:class II fructose-bisphosphate aldolase [Patescibacteria group bacterium]|nr:class II fructose-bisphosphate aldolase [Patescibacteria group bacterium]
MNTLREYIKEAQEKKVAIGHFNFSNIEGLYAIARAARTLGVPVIVGLSEGEEEAIGTHAAVALVKTIRETWNLPIFLNADHHYSFASVKACIDAGFDAVIYDGAKLDFDENVVVAKQCVEYARKVSKETGRDILVEVELGYIGEGSMMRDSAPEGVVNITSPVDAKRFMEETGADMLAPAVGTFHGMLKTAAKPRLNIESIQALTDTLHLPMVLHGGSGNDADFALAIQAGIVIVHVNTEIRRAYTTSVREWLAAHPDDIAPYKYGGFASLAMEAVVTKNLKMFNNIPQ